MDDDRYEFLLDKIGHVEDRVTDLENHQDKEEARMLEWWVIALIVIEILEAVVIAYLELRHG
jgi:uncharacterized Rmd1/YagE family protein